MIPFLYDVLPFAVKMMLQELCSPPCALLSINVFFLQIPKLQFIRTFYYAKYTNKPS